MKKYFIHSLFIFLVLSATSSKGQTFKFANTVSGLSNQYGISGNSVFKIDLNGNTIWVKDFTGFIEISNFSNVLYGSAFDGKYLYVLEMQGQTTSGPPPTYNPAVIKMDTLGNVLFVKSDYVQPGGSYSVVDIFPSFTNGAWVMDNYAPGFTHYGRVLKIDSLGQMGPDLGFWYGSVASPVKICNMPDSNYITCVNHRPSSPGLSLSFPTLTKFDEQGTILWQSDYAISGGTVNDYLACTGITIDSIGNTYLICDFNAFGNSCLAGIKIDPAGNVLNSKYWPNLSYGSLRSLKFENGELICQIVGADLHLDSNLSNSCVNEQSLAIATGNSYIQSSGNFSYSTASFSPINSSPFIYSPTIYPDYCATSIATEIPASNTNFRISPNPATDKIEIKSNVNSKYTVSISDLQGRMCLQISSNEISSLDVSNLKKGIYFVNFTNENFKETKKLVVE